MIKSGSQSINANATTGSNIAVNMNKYLRGNIKKMKIDGHNYAQLVNYAKQKFSS
jgi:hypothetical protein